MLRQCLWMLFCPAVVIALGCEDVYPKGEVWTLGCAAIFACEPGWHERHLRKHQSRMCLLIARVRYDPSLRLLFKTLVCVLPEFDESEGRSLTARRSGEVIIPLQ